MAARIGAAESGESFSMQRAILSRYSSHSATPTLSPPPGGGAAPRRDASTAPPSRGGLAWDVPRPPEVAAAVAPFAASGAAGFSPLQPATTTTNSATARIMPPPKHEALPAVNGEGLVERDCRRLTVD